MDSALDGARPRERRRSAFTSLSKTVFAIVVLSTPFAGCVFAPTGLRDERQQLESKESTYEPPLEKRSLPELSDTPGWREILARALIANGELEARYFEWKAALERVEIVAGWPNTNLMPSVSYMLSGGGMKAWDRTTVNLGFDPMQSLSLPSKVRAAGEIALEQAREAGSRFASAKFELQRRVLDNWLNLALLEEQVRIQSEFVDLGQISFESAAQRAAVEGKHGDLLRAQVEQRMAQIELDGLRAEARASRAMLNGLLMRDADAELALAPMLPEPRDLPVDDAALIAAGVENNPELRALAFVVSARDGALDLARLQYLPDINPFVGFTGSVQQMIGVGVSLPTRLPQIRAGIDEATAMLRAAAANLRQSTLDRRASFVAALYMLRYAEHQAQFFEREIEPLAEQAVGSLRQAYSTGAASFTDLIDAHRVLLDIRLGIAEARIEREHRLSELEFLAGVDIETLGTVPAQTAQETENDRHE